MSASTNDGACDDAGKFDFRSCEKPPQKVEEHREIHGKFLLVLFLNVREKRCPSAIKLLPPIKFRSKGIVTVSSGIDKFKRGR